MKGLLLDVRTALAKLQEDTIAAQVCESEAWRAESFIHAMRGLRHLTQLVNELESAASEAGPKAS